MSVDLANPSPRRMNSGTAKIESYADAVKHFKSNDRIKAYDMQVPKPLTLSWNCDGTRLASGAEKSVAVVTFDQSFRSKNMFHGYGHTEQVDDVAFHPSDTNMLASASADHTVRLWDVRQTRTHTRLLTKAQNMNVVWSPCASLFIYGDKEDTLNMVDGRTLKTIKMEKMKMEVNQFAFDPTGKFLFVALGGGQIGIFSMPDMTRIKTLRVHSAHSSCVCIAVTPDGKHFAVGGTDAICSVWDIKEFICISNMLRLDYPLRSISFSSDSRLMACASEDHFIDIAWTETADRVYELRVQAESYTCAWHPSATLLAYASATPAESREREVNVKIFGFTM